jgi:hypothetical protein
MCFCYDALITLLGHMSELLAPLLSLNPDLSDIVSVGELNWYSEVLGFRT